MRRILCVQSSGYLEQRTIYANFSGVQEGKDDRNYILQHIVRRHPDVMQLRIQHRIARSQLRQLELRNHHPLFYNSHKGQSTQRPTSTPQGKLKEDLLMENTLTIPSIVTLTTLSPSSPPAPPPALINCTPIFTVVCCPNLTIFVPDLQSQQTSALSAPADTKFLEDSATARMPLR